MVRPDQLHMNEALAALELNLTKEAFQELMNRRKDSQQHKFMHLLMAPARCCRSCRTQRRLAAAAQHSVHIAIRNLPISSWTEQTHQNVRLSFGAILMPICSVAWFVCWSHLNTRSAVLIEQWDPAAQTMSDETIDRHTNGSITRYILKGHLFCETLSSAMSTLLASVDALVQRCRWMSWLKSCYTNWKRRKPMSHVVF